jgi:hypothetical protein
MIFAQMTSEMIKQEAQRAKEQAKAEGKGFFGQWSDQLKVSFGLSQRYLRMAPSAIIVETPGNFEADNNTITEVKIKRKNVVRNGDDNYYEFEMEVHSYLGTHQLKIGYRDDYIKLLKKVCGDRVKMPFGYFSSTININL